MRAVLSVDVAKCKSMVMLSTEYGEVLIEPKEIKHNLKEFDELKNQINNFKLEDLTIFMESTGIYHLPVERYFKEQGFNTLVINSLTTKNNYDTLRKEHNDLIKADKTGEGYIKDMFVSELENHEYGYTYELDDTLDALELTREQIANSPNLKHGLDLAKKEVLKKENEVNLDYE